MSLSIHRASLEERRAAHRNSHEEWGGEETVTAYLERCLASPRHNRAEWWVLRLDGEIAASLALHPLSFRYAGQSLSGFGIGSVHTVSEMRRQGHAMALCRAAMNAALARGDRFGLLFSDIAPDYYARLGFRICPHERFTCPDLTRLVDSGERCLLEPFEGRENIGFLIESHEGHHRDDVLALWRDRSDWRFLLDANADLRFLRLRDQDGTALGYAWIHQDDSQLVPVELVLNQPDVAVEARAYRALAEFALSRSISKISGWNPPPDSIFDYFSVTPRSKGIPMLWVDPDVLVAGKLAAGIRLYSSAYF